MSFTPEDYEHYGNASVSVGYDFQTRTYASPPTAEESRAAFEAAKAEFDAMRPEARHHPRSLKLVAMIYRGLENWGELAATAKTLVDIFPGELRWLIDWADGARHSESIESARDIVENAAAQYGDNADLLLEGARYAALLGNIADGRQLLAKATAAGGAAISGKAICESDFSPLLDGLTSDDFVKVLHLPVVA